MKIRLLIIVIMFALASCKNAAPPSAPARTQTPPAVLKTIHWTPVIMDTNGAPITPDGYKISCTGGTPSVSVTVDVGNVLEYPLDQVIKSDGTWSCIVIPYDLSNPVRGVDAVTPVTFTCTKGVFTK